MPNRGPDFDYRVCHDLWLRSWTCTMEMEGERMAAKGFVSEKDIDKSSIRTTIKASMNKYTTASNEYYTTSNNGCG